MFSLFCSFENSVTEEIHINWLRTLEYFYVQHRLFTMSYKRKYVKKPYVGKKRKAWNKTVFKRVEKEAC